MMRPRPRPADRPLRRLLSATGALAAGALILAACGGDPEPESEGPELGTVDFPTSCSSDVQPDLERGVALLHHMMYEQARDVFRTAAEAEEDCALAHWGVAMSHFQPLWGSAQVDEGRPAAERAVELDPPTDRERGYASAALAFYEGEDLELGERIRSWETAMEELHMAEPGDPEAASLYALSHLAVDPADPERQERADQILQELHQEMPRHPGAVHYSIHVHDVEQRAEDGVRFAEAYDQIAPAVPHALHMPSHIYVRLGDWERVTEWNRQSADAALDYPVGDYISHHNPHALDYLMYGYLQRGEDERARAVLEELHSRDGYQQTFVSAYALAAIPARWHVERRDWEGAANLEARVPASFPWDNFPYAEAMTHFARGLGAARSGDLDRAREAVSRLGALEEASREMDPYWADQVQVQRRSVSAWHALAEGRTDEAVQEMREAADLAASMQKHPVTPGELQPANELLGDLLLEAGQPADALEAYERSLATWPRRYHSLLGAARAAEEAGQDDVATSYYDELAELAPDADSGREGAQEAQDRAE